MPKSRKGPSSPDSSSSLKNLVKEEIRAALREEFQEIKASIKEEISSAVQTAIKEAISSIKSKVAEQDQKIASLRDYIISSEEQKLKRK